MAKRISPNTVIDLTLDSDEEQQSRLADVTKRLYSNNNAERSTKRARTVETTSSEPLEADEEVEVVEAAIASPVAAPNVNVEENPDEELQVVGTRNELKLPHHRHDCTVHPFTVKAANRDQLRIQNERHCDLCYCYVCDAPVKDCKSWSNVDGVWQNSHCNATDKQSWWAKEREAVKSGNGGAAKGVGGQNSLTAPARPHLTLPPTTATANRTANASAAGGSSNPSHVAGSSSNSSHTLCYAPGKLSSYYSTKAYPPCKHCGWHSHVKHMKKKGRCLRCGRLTVQLTQHKQYEPEEGRVDYNFGERQIGFRLIARDVRRSDRYSKGWEEADKNDPRWQYTEAAMKQSMVDLWLGRFPSLRLIMDLVTEWDEEKARKKNVEAMILDNQDDIALLRILNEVGIGSNKPKGQSGSLYCGDIAATWDAQTETGTLKIRLFLPSQCTRELHRNSSHALLLGCWFKIFPLKLESISGTLKASSPQFSASLRPPSRAGMDTFRAAVSSHNKKADELISALTLTSGCSNRDIGGFTNNDISLRGMLERFYREHFPHRSFAKHKIQKIDDWNKISNHKGSTEASDHDFVLNNSDRRFAAMCLANAASSVSGDSTQNLLAHLEDLGHEPELTCEGLTVELLEFQKQSLKWAMEREATPGGIQSYFWVKVPIEDSTLYFNPVLGRFRKDKPKTVRGGIIADEMGLGKVCDVIECMSYWCDSSTLTNLKTIISLALILKHPAPELPISGSDVSCLANAPISAAAGSDSNALQWDADLYSQTSTRNKLRGSVLSRGTLVVCPVSLVGQWIEEAKSKLSNPGLLYPYHGGKRIRDAKKLAKNAIVVTTYQVLASDDNYHRYKSPNPDKYCPPLEQVRWWRIICDEGHSLRQAGSQRNGSLSQLVADNKWMVTGTPVSTSMNDLKSQLQLIGVEHVDRMFQRPRLRFGCQKGPTIAQPGNLRFLLRNIMIRHTQNQLYRGTNTTLMSLPPKTERSIEIMLSNAERKEYDALDKEARDFYVRFKANHSRELSKNYLLLSQKLTPQRVACAGGHPPLLNEEAVVQEDNGDEETQLRKKTGVKLSDFCFTSKLMALVEELKRARDSDPTSKSLVFSQFNMTLDWLKRELPNHGFQFRTLSGSMTMKQRAKALHDFQADPPTTIFLLSMRAGNCGINLTQANRVFLMEPCFNPALEKQAIGRVHRLGQKRNVEIIRLFVKDSIETRIFKFLGSKYGIHSHHSKEGSKGKQKASDSDKVEDDVVEVVGNLASERPKNAIVTSEFDLLFGVESKREGTDSSMPEVAMPDTAISSDFL